MSKIEAGISLIAVLDGTTVNGFVRVDNCPLVQRYTRGSDEFVPDFTKLPEKPTILVILRDAVSGDILTPRNLKFRYNGTLIAFGGDGFSTTAGFERKFKLIDSYNASVGGSKTVTMPAMEVVGNLVPISGYDNDRITVSGQVEVMGQTIDFNELPTTVIIQESTGNQYDVILNNDKGSALYTDGDSLTEKVSVFKDGKRLTDVSKFKFAWYKVTTAGDQVLTAEGTAQTQKITTADVDNVLKIRCDVMEDKTVVAAGFDEITDFSDPYYVQIGLSSKSNTIRRGETVTVTPKAVRRSDGIINPNVVWKYRAVKNDGSSSNITLATGASCRVTYDQVAANGYGITIYIEGTL